MERERKLGKKKYEKVESERMGRSMESLGEGEAVGCGTWGRGEAVGCGTWGREEAVGCGTWGRGVAVDCGTWGSRGTGWGRTKKLGECGRDKERKERNRKWERLRERLWMEGWEKLREGE